MKKVNISIAYEEEKYAALTDVPYAKKYEFGNGADCSA